MSIKEQFDVTDVAQCKNVYKSLAKKEKYGLIVVRHLENEVTEIRVYQYSESHNQFNRRLYEYYTTNGKWQDVYSDITCIDDARKLLRNSNILN